MYTVLESEIGGYIYVWFDYYPETQETYLKNIAYVDKLMYVFDFSAIQEGSNIDDVIKITKTVSAQKINPEWFPLRKSQILCKDGLLTITYDEILTVTNIKVHEDFIIYSESKNIINGNWNNRNYTILPQDYPPAS